MGKIKVAIAGVGNCASSLIQGVAYYSQPGAKQRGVMYENIGGYAVSDIEFVVAFDIDKRKVGIDLSKAIFSEPNCTVKFSEVRNLGVPVLKSPALDGVARNMKTIFLVDDRQKEVDVAQKLRDSGADILISYMPVGSADATRFFAQSALDAGVAFINAIPEFVCSSIEWDSKYKAAGIPCAGDDIKSQIGATIVHRALTRLIEDRGVKIDSMYQLNIGGNTDFLNMSDESRVVSKRISKTRAVTSIMDSEIGSIKVGPSDYVEHLRDNKVCYINIQGRQFGNVPFEIDLKLSVEDSPNSAGVITEAIRALKVAKDRGMSGNINEISAYLFKSPSFQVRDDIAKNNFESFMNSKIQLS